MRLALAVLLAACGSPVAAAPTPPAGQAFPLRDVRILDGPFRDAQQRGLAYLLSLDPDRLLHTFRMKSPVKDVGIFRPPHAWSFSPNVKLLPPGRD